MLNRKTNIQVAWRALKDSGEHDGYRAIAIDTRGLCMAGLDLESRRESVFFGFQKKHGAISAKLPQGQGFHVAICDLPSPYDDRTWLSLVRRPQGNLEIFTLMATDVLSYMERLVLEDDVHIFDLFLERVRAWQAFMLNRERSVLDLDAEMGLFGELLFLKSIMEQGFSPNIALDSWRGPSGAIHDFSLGKGAIEVKTSLKTTAIVVHISSLSQLDDCLASPLYLCVVRLDLHEEGLTLPEFASLLAERFESNQLLKHSFETLLISAGFHSQLSSSYTRRFRHDETLLYLVHERFPRLIARGVSPAITKATYDINLDSERISELSLSNIILSMGV